MNFRIGINEDGEPVAINMNKVQYIHLSGPENFYVFYFVGEDYPCEKLRPPEPNEIINNHRSFLDDTSFFIRDAGEW